MNRTFFTVAYVFALVSGILYCITIIGIVFGILNIVAAGRIKNYRDGVGGVTQSNLTGWAIYLIFTSIVAGILVLAGLESNQTQDAPATTAQPQSFEAKLIKLNELYDAGKITKEEYDAARAQIISNVS